MAKFLGFLAHTVCNSLIIDDIVNLGSEDMGTEIMLLNDRAAPLPSIGKGVVSLIMTYLF